MRCERVFAGLDVGLILTHARKNSKGEWVRQHRVRLEQLDDLAKTRTARNHDCRRVARQRTVRIHCRSKPQCRCRDDDGDHDEDRHRCVDERASKLRHPLRRRCKYVSRIMAAANLSTTVLRFLRDTSAEMSDFWTAAVVRRSSTSSIVPSNARPKWTTKASMSPRDALDAVYALKKLQAEG